MCGVVVVLDAVFNSFDFFVSRFNDTHIVIDDPEKIMDQVTVWLFSVTVIICIS
jgi:hypothetical protein